MIFILILIFTLLLFVLNYIFSFIFITILLRFVKLILLAAKLDFWFAINDYCVLAVLVFIT